MLFQQKKLLIIGCQLKCIVAGNYTWHGGSFPIILYITCMWIHIVLLVSHREFWYYWI